METRFSESTATVLAHRMDEHTLRLHFKLTEPQQVTLNLACFDADWVWEQDLGVRTPDNASTQIRILDWPEETTYMMARFFEKGGRSQVAAAQWLPTSKEILVPFS